MYRLALVLATAFASIWVFMNPAQAADGSFGNVSATGWIQSTGSGFYAPSGRLGLGANPAPERVSIVSFDNTLATNIASFKAANLTQGVGISWSGIRKLTTTGDNHLYLDAASTGNVILNANGGTGNVGIGTSSPTSKLEVNGDMRVTGATTFTGAVILVQPQGDISMGVFQ